MNITYDTVKNKLNKKKHKIDLSDAEGVLYDEKRFVTLGINHFGYLLVVTYHYRGENDIRIISARHAEPHERRTYEG
jgi:uncharacterized DUF497 family protein